MKIKHLGALFGAALAFMGSHAAQANFSATGTFVQDSDLVFFKVVADGATPNTIRSYGYAGGSMDDSTVVSAGGFDTLITLYDVYGYRVGGAELNDDGAGVPTDPATGEALDSLYQATIAAGTYYLVLSQSNNYGADYIGTPFGWDGLTNPTATNGCSQGFFCDYTGADRDGHWALDVLGFTSVEALDGNPVPEPGTLALFGLGLMGMLRKKRAV